MYMSGKKRLNSYDSADSRSHSFDSRSNSFDIPIANISVKNDNATPAKPIVIRRRVRDKPIKELSPSPIPDNLLYLTIMLNK